MWTMRLVTLAIAVAPLYGCAVEDDLGELESESRDGPSRRYLAIGDSVAFGYDPLLVPARTDRKFRGYTKAVARDLGLRERNFACPGETSGSAISATAPDNGCRDYRAAFDLHVDYDGPQLSAVITELTEARRPPSLITYALGANDLLGVLATCAGDINCALINLPPVLQGVGNNVGFALASLRAAGYSGPIVMPNYYYPVLDQGYILGVSALNDVLAQVGAAFGATRADVFGAFVAASASTGGDPCAAGLLIALPGGGCDIHPSPAGDRVIADAVLEVVE
jgi:lysophospholipase L1-like esterase